MFTEPLDVNVSPTGALVIAQRQRKAFRTQTNKQTNDNVITEKALPMLLQHLLYARNSIHKLFQSVTNRPDKGDRRRANQFYFNCNVTARAAKSKMAFRLNGSTRTRLIRTLLFAAVCFISAFVWINLRRGAQEENSQSVSAPSPQQASPSPLTAFTTTVTPNATPDAAAAAQLPPPLIPGASPSSSPLNEREISALALDKKSLLIPVAGVRPDQLQDTYTAARSEGRVHDAIDIPAARNTPVLACADGTIVKFFQSVRGGTTIYQLDPDNKTVYYYAHLDHYADGLTENHFARRGELIGYVGDTGNAGSGNYHLHFSISIVSDPKHFYDGANINPYPLLRHSAP